MDMEDVYIPPNIFPDPNHNFNNCFGWFKVFPGSTATSSVSTRVSNHV